MANFLKSLGILCKIFPLSCRFLPSVTKYRIIYLPKRYLQKKDGAINPLTLHRLGTKLNFVPIVCTLLYKIKENNTVTKQFKIIRGPLLKKAHTLK